VHGDGWFGAGDASTPDQPVGRHPSTRVKSTRE
jgi:hypothetical protein